MTTVASCSAAWAHRTFLPFAFAAVTLGGLIACDDPSRSRNQEDPAARHEAAQARLAPETVFLDSLAERTFRFFWEQTDAETGMSPDRYPTESFVSVAATGFALTAYPIGVERGWVAREDAAARALRTLEFFHRSPQDTTGAGAIGHRGFFYHFLEPETGHRFRDVELSTIDTALFLAGALFCQSYFDGTSPTETSVRALADSLYLRVEWDWAAIRPPILSHGWTPEEGHLPWDWRGYNEAMILYLLALGSPTHPIAPEAWTEWVAGYQWGEFHGQEHIGFAPLFGHQYSHVWIDFRGIQDAYTREKGIDYFENSRRATLAQRAYAIENPMAWAGYGERLWGLTACDGPLHTRQVVGGEERQFETYWARGASFTEVRDDGTIAPTAMAASLPFAPEVVLPGLLALRQGHPEAWSTYGFLDALNPTFTFDVPVQHGRVVPGSGWVDTDYLGIDQGPILAMIENHRTELVWKHMKRNPHLVRGLRAAGFRGGWLDDGSSGAAPTGTGREPETVVFWAMGREGEVARDVIVEFERLHPDIRVEVQQVPWSAAHEKLVTSVVGRSTPDVSQLGNTWIAEFVALGALEPLGDRVRASAEVRRDDFFPGIWDTNVIGTETYGIPWYVDTRLLFYRTDLLAKAGRDSIPSTWKEWRESLGAMKDVLGPDAFPLFLPVNEWPPPVILGLQNGSTLLRENDTRGAFSEPAFRDAFAFYIDLFRSGYAPSTANNEIGNLYQEFSRGHVNGFITGPWNLGELKNRLPAEQADVWSTSPLPGPEPGRPGVSLAGGSSLVLFRGSKRKDAAWKLIEFLSRPDTQLRFYELSGDLPARVSVWQAPTFQEDPRLAAFGAQLAHVVSTPKIPEWEQIAAAVLEHAEIAIRGGADMDSTLARLDRRVDRILEKRRWLHERGRLASASGNDAREPMPSGAER